MFQNRVANCIAGTLILMVLPGLLAAQPIATADAEADDTFLVDTSSGDRFRLKLRMREFLETDPGSKGGRGSVAMFLRGPGIAACSVHGPRVRTSDFATFPNSDLTPLQGVECGRSGVQTVVIEGCVARTSFHGYVHLDHLSGVNFLGTATTDVVLHKIGQGVKADVTIHTPKETINLSGKIRSPGPVNISTCNK